MHQFAGEGVAEDSANDEWPAAVARLSRFLLELYRLASTAPASKFQKLALGAARQVVDFDSALWASGALGDSGAKIHAAFGFKLAPESIEGGDGLNLPGALLHRALERPGQSVRATAFGPDGEAPGAPAFVAEARRYGLEQALGTVHLDPAIGLFEGVFVYRADPARPFSASEQLLKQCLLPHLAEAWCIKRLAGLAPERRQAAPVRLATALCDNVGILYAASPNLAALLQLEWPGWLGPLLPPALACGARRHVGEHIVVSLEACNELCLLRVRQRLTIDALSQRELDIARRYAEGRSYQEIAGILHLAPATVRNHLNNIYSKLGICDKAALANLVRRN